MTVTTRVAAEVEDVSDLSLGARLAGGLAGGLVAGLAMLLTMSAFALSQGRGAMYPIHAVHALMSGRRVLPDFPGGSLKGPQQLDVVVGPFYFFLPAVVVGVLTAWWMARRLRCSSEVPRRLVAAAGAVLAAAAFVVFVVEIGFHESTRTAQKASTGYGVQELGMTAWLFGHLAYVVVLVALLGPLTRAVVVLRDRRKRAGAL